MSTIISAPYPNDKVTTVLPSAEFTDSRAARDGVTVKRSMLGRTITYVSTTDRETLNLPLRLTRMKALELEAFIQSYRSATWRIKMYDNTTWEAKLLGRDVVRNAIDRLGGASASLTGSELVNLTLQFSAKKLT